MTSNPWSAFFWNDYEGDRNLRQCSLSAQGLWMRMLCIAAKADPAGYVQVGDIPCPLDRMPAMLSADIGKPADEIAILLRELESWHVFGIDRQHRIYNRRMIREQKKRRASSKGGKKGGRVTYEKQTGIFTTQDAAQDVAQGHARRTHTISISNTISKESESLSYESSPIVLNRERGPSLEREAFRVWNEMAAGAGLPLAEKFTKARKAGLAARVRDCGGLARWAEIIGGIPSLRWMLGENDRGWKANLDFILRPASFLRLMEGVYAQAPPKLDYGQLAFDTLAAMTDAPCQQSPPEILPALPKSATS